MMINTRRVLNLVAAAATGVALFALGGCGKDAPTPAPTSAALPSNAPAVYMNDPVFQRQLAEKKHELQAIINERQPLAERMQELVRAHGEDLAALQQLPEWNELYEKVKALNARYQEVRARQLKVVRERLAPGAGGDAVSK